MTHRPDQRTPAGVGVLALRATRRAPADDVLTAPLPRQRAAPFTGPFRGVVDAVADTATERLPTLDPALDPAPDVAAGAPRPHAGRATTARLATLAGAAVVVLPALRAAGWADDAALGALAVVTAATLLGAWTASRWASKLGLWLSLASAMMMVGALTDILPHVWHEAEEVGTPWWAPGLAVAGGFAVITLFTRSGHGHDHGEASPADPPTGRHRPTDATSRAAGVGVLGAATALTIHRVIEGATLALSPSAAVIGALLVHSASEGLALAALFAQTRRSPMPWLTLAVAGPAVGIVVASVGPLPEVAVPVLLAVVAGVLLRTALVGLGMAAAQRRAGELAGSQIAVAVVAAVALGALGLLAGH